MYVRTSVVALFRDVSRYYDAPLARGRACLRSMRERTPFLLGYHLSPESDAREGSFFLKSCAFGSGACSLPRVSIRYELFKGSNKRDKEKEREKWEKEERKGEKFEKDLVGRSVGRSVGPPLGTAMATGAKAQSQLGS